MPVEVGKRYYFFTHAYHHFIAEVVGVTGKREADVRRVIRVQSCPRSWADFFRDGLRDDTSYSHFPDGSITWFDAFEWHHEIPSPPESDRATRRQPRP